MFKTKKEQAVASGNAVAEGSASGPQYTSGDVARLAGVSLRQLQWWDERNVVRPVQEGHRRLYQQKDVIEVSVIAELRRKGFSLQRIRRVLKFLQKEMGGRRLADAVAENSDIHLITDGKNIYLEDQPDRIIDVMKNAKQPMFLVCVTDQWRRFQPGGGRKPVRSSSGNENSAASLKTRLG
jgi:DNA-binding transcriptional MerR regulator